VFLETTYIVSIIRPFSSRRTNEIVAAPKVYAFDTGFVLYLKGFKEIRDDDLGMLWEHFVLNHIQGKFQQKELFYWRDKAGHEVDFIYIAKGKVPMVIECKWKGNLFNPKNLKIFRNYYPEGKNIVIASDIKEPYKRKFGEIEVNFMNINHIRLE
jgi:predicted AAA+ superfamily ATPase